MQLSAYMDEAKDVDDAMCEAFHKRLNDHPEEIMKTLAGGDGSAFKKGL